jgi:ATP-binding cassette subfamily B protein
MSILTEDFTVRSVYGRFFHYGREDRFYFALVVIAIIGVTVTNTAMIWLLGEPINLIQSGHFEEIYSLLLILVLVLLLNQGLQLASQMTSNWLALRYIGRLRCAVLDQLYVMSFTGAARFHKGDMLARLSNDVDRAEALVLEIPLGLVSSTVTILFYSAMLFVINWQLALAAMFFAPVFYFHQRFFAPRKARASKRFFEENGRLLSFEEQSLGNLRGISSFQVESRMGKLHRLVFGVARSWAMRMRWIDAWFGLSFTVLIYLGGLLIMFLGIRAIQNGGLAVGQLLSFILYLGYMSGSVRGFAQAPIQYKGDLAAAQRVAEVLDAKGVTESSENAQTLNVSRGDIEISDLHFRYPDGTLVFNGIDIHISGGSSVALVGPSGSGKSTLATLLMRFYDLQSGSITIDGKNIKDITLSSLRASLAVVWQDIFVVNDSIRANLVLASPNASEEEIIQACQSSHAWEFIEMFPGGLDTRVGAGGVELSGGQRQRLAIAQAFLRDAPILILDEASAALDSQSEQMVIKALEELRHDRTTLIIAHRYSSIRSADLVVYFEADGSVVTGQHDELVVNHLAYREAVEWQTGLVGGRVSKGNVAQILT